MTMCRNPILPHPVREMLITAVEAGVEDRARSVEISTVVVVIIISISRIRRRFSPATRPRMRQLVRRMRESRVRTIVVVRRGVGIGTILMVATETGQLSGQSKAALWQWLNVPSIKFGAGWFQSSVAMALL